MDREDRSGRRIGGQLRVNVLLYVTITQNVQKVTRCLTIRGISSSVVNIHCCLKEFQLISINSAIFL